MPTPPPLPTDDRQPPGSLEDAYRQSIGVVRALAKSLGQPDPIATREERRALERLRGAVYERERERLLTSGRLLEARQLEQLRAAVFPSQDFPPIADT